MSERAASSALNRPAPRKEMLNQRELAEHLGVTPTTLRRWLAEGAFIPPVNGYWFWPVVAAWWAEMHARMAELEQGEAAGDLVRVSTKRLFSRTHK